MAAHAVNRGDPDLETPVIRAERGLCARCPQWEKCIFHVKRHGGFKGQGKRHVGYRLITDAAEGHDAKEDFMTCENFTEVMLDRMRHGAMLRAEGKDGEIISIIAQEGETITRRVNVGFNARNQVIRPMREMIPALEAAGYKVNLDDMSSPIEFRPVDIEAEIPKFRPLHVGRDDYAEKMAQRALAAEIETEASEDAAWEAARAKQKAEDARRKQQLEDVLDMDDAPMPTKGKAKAEPDK